MKVIRETCRPQQITYLRFYYILSKREIMIPLTVLTPPHLYACPTDRTWFTTSRVLFIFVHSELRWEEIVRLVYIGVIVDHHCLHWSVKWFWNQWIIFKKSLCNIHKNVPAFCFIFNELVQTLILAFHIVFFQDLLWT